MVLWIYRHVRNLVGAVVALIGLVSTAEVWLKASRIYDAVENKRETVSDLPGWMLPSGSTGWELPRAAKFDLPARSGGGSWSTNSFGIRGPEVAVPKPGGVYRILCLGDETLLGPELGDDALFAQQLQALLQQRTQYRIEVIAAPLPCGCPLSLAIHHRLHLTSLQPDLVLLQTSAGDVEDDRTLRRWTIRDAAGLPLACVHPDLRGPKTENLVAVCRSEFALVDLCFEQLVKAGKRTGTGAGSVDRLGTLNQERVRECLLPTMQLAAHCEAAYSRLVVWFSPQVGTPEGLVQHREFISLAGAYFAEQRLPAVDVGGSFAEGMYAAKNRWTSAGHRRAAEVLAGQLIQNLPGPWSSPTSVPVAVPASYMAPAAGGIPEIRRAIR
ncbi:MAG: hypothetical protein SFV23_12345 [Planctomycetaceae bacterium]|nr:hypothetical protein [Planctomycetaceae bacterium]